ncbi:MAG: tetratricopeptide repeat protein [Cyclobacteriaceae bacterium]
MKKTVLTMIGIVCAAILFANDGQFEKAMAKNIQAMYQASDTETLQGVINQLTRIGDAEGDRWEPYYYSAFGYVRAMSMSESNEAKDKYLDQALVAIKKGETIKPNDSELESLRGYVHMMRVTVDPASRGQQYSGMAFGSFQKAISLNPKNGRAHFLLGRMQLGMAQFMGGGDGGACESYATAKAILESEEKNEQSIAPSWGLNGTIEAIKETCEG